MSAPAPRWRKPKRVRCKCGHKLHEAQCQRPVRDPHGGYVGCGCFRVDGVLPPEWRAYYGE